MVSLEKIEEINKGDGSLKIAIPFAVCRAIRCYLYCWFCRADNLWNNRNSRQVRLEPYTRIRILKMI